MNLNIYTHYNPESLLLGVYPVEISAHVYKKTSTRTFIWVLFIIVKKICPSMKEKLGNYVIFTWWNIMCVEKEQATLYWYLMLS